MSRPTTLLDPFEALNDQQRLAVMHGRGDASPGPLLVIAGAGSGKTMALACRVARLVLDGADPQRILMLTFSRRAAQEMAHRVGRVLHQALRLPSTSAPPALPWCGTFHAIGARMLREHAQRIGLPDDFTIHDRGDAEDMIGVVRQALGFAASEKRFPTRGTCLAIYSRVVNSQMPLVDVLDAVFPWCRDHADALRQLFSGYVMAKQQQHTLDYDDLLLYWHQMASEPAWASLIGARFDHLLVDEYQDTNRLQSSILHALKPAGQGVCVVGDDAQSIYAFRAAELRNILDFPARFEPPATVVTLDRNYRSTQPLLDASNAVISLAAERYTKNLWTDLTTGEPPQLVAVEDDAAQARWVADQVLLQRESGLVLKRQAVLFRAGHHSAGLELELMRRQIPFVKYGGLKFLEAAHVKDVLAVLRWAQNPRSRLAGFRVATLIPGIGAAGARRLLDAMAQSPDPVAAMRSFRPPVAANAEWHAWLRLSEQLTSSAWPDDITLAAAWYRPHLERLHDDATVRQADLDQLGRIARGFASRERFLTELTLDPPQATSDESGPPLRDEDYLILSTMHSAKGQEWTAVYLLNVVDGCMPSDMATGHAAEIEEERRLLYVAMTRAKRHLQLIVPQRFYVTQQSQRGDRHLYGSLTRFIPPALHERFEWVSAKAEREAAWGTTAEVPPIDLAARVRALF